MESIIDFLWEAIKPLLIEIGIPLLLVIAVWIGAMAFGIYVFPRLRLWAYLVCHLFGSCLVLLIAHVWIPGFVTSWRATKEAVFWPFVLTLIFVGYAFVECVIMGLQVDDDDQWVVYPKRGKNWWGKRKRVFPPLAVVLRWLILWFLSSFVIVHISAHGFLSAWQLWGKIVFWMVSATGLNFVDDKLQLVRRIEMRLAQLLDPVLFGGVIIDDEDVRPKLPFGDAREATVNQIREAGLL